MRRYFHLHFLKAVALTLFTAVLPIENSFAQSTWQGGVSSAGLLGNVTYWENTSNWSPNGVPGNTTATIFGTPPGSTTVFVGLNNVANSMTFNSGVGFTFTGDPDFPSGTTITLGNSGANSNPFIRNSSTGNQQINLGVGFLSTATGTRTIENTSSGSITFGAVNAVNSIVTNPVGTLAVTNSGATGAITFNGAVNVGSVGPLVNGTLAISNSSTGNVTFNSSVNASNGITKSGTGTAVFNSAVSAGASGITVSGGRMQGVGAVSSLTTIGGGGSYSAGNGVGAQSINSLAFNSGSQFQWDLNGTGNVAGTNFDRVSGLTSLSINSGATSVLNISGIADASFWNINRSWDVFVGNFTNPGSVFGSISLTGANAPGVGLGSFAWESSNNNVRLNFITAVPEPSSMALLGMAGLIGGVYARRRAKKNKA